MSIHSDKRRITVSTLSKMRSEGKKIACLTAYDATFAGLADCAGIDVLLVGDTLGMVVQGCETTVGVTMDDMVYHTRLASRGRKRALLMADLPFLSATDPAQALQNAGRLMQEGGADMVKLEGGGGQAEVVRRLSENGVPVCAHLGLHPQFVHKIGGYRVQGREKEAAQALLEDAQTLEAAGADILLFECVPAALAAELTAAANIPVIGIGAGDACNGQILVLHDVLGITPGRMPSFARNFMSGRDSIVAALGAYAAAVREGSFPTPDESF